MAEKFPQDQFDQLPEAGDRVGAHRAPERSFRRLKYFGWVALATVLVAGVGIGAVVVIDNGIFSAADDNSTPVSTIVPTVDPSVPITVLNGTSTDSLDDSASQVLKKAGFTVASSTNASQDNLTTSTVYYSGDSFQAVAEAAAQTLGISAVKQSTQFSTTIGSDLTIVLGTDYVPSTVG